MLDRTGPQSARQRRVAGEVAQVEQAEGDLDVLPGDRERLGDGTCRVVQTDPRVPDRVPDLLGQSSDVLRFVQEYEVDVPVRGALPPAEPADRDERHPG